jgi:hypothetical protein
MKKPSAILRSVLLALVMVPYLLVVTGVLSNFIAFYHRYSFQAQVIISQQEDLKILALSASEYKKINWIEDGKEFEYFGKMYDVAKMERQGSNYMISCENDSLEDLFLSLWKAAGKSKSKMIPQIQISQPITEFKIKSPINSSEKIGSPAAIFYPSFLAEIIPPPPRVS